MWVRFSVFQSFVGLHICEKQSQKPKATLETALKQSLCASKNVSSRNKGLSRFHSGFQRYLCTCWMNFNVLHSPTRRNRPHSSRIHIIWFHLWIISSCVTIRCATFLDYTKGDLGPRESASCHLGQRNGIQPREVGNLDQILLLGVVSIPAQKPCWRPWYWLMNTEKLEKSKRKEKNVPS